MTNNSRKGEGGSNDHRAWPSDGNSWGTNHDEVCAIQSPAKNKQSNYRGSRRQRARKQQQRLWREKIRGLPPHPPPRLPIPHLALHDEARRARCTPAKVLQRSIAHRSIWSPSCPFGGLLIVRCSVYSSQSIVVQNVSATTNKITRFPALCLPPSPANKQLPSGALPNQKFSTHAGHSLSLFLLSFVSPI